MENQAFNPKNILKKIERSNSSIAVFNRDRINSLKVLKSVYYMQVKYLMVFGVAVVAGN